MNLRKVVMPLAASAALLVMGVAPRAHAATFTVTKLADSNDGACNSDCSLREAVVAANAAAGSDIIVVAANLSGSAILNTALPVISGALTINGPGAAKFVVTRNVSGGSFRIFDTAARSRLSLKDLTVSNGASNTGAGIHNNGGTLTVTRCVLQNNVAADEGGGIYNDTTTAIATATIIDTTFKDNQAAPNAGGGFFNEGRNHAANATMIGCTFSDNRARRGGAIYNYGPASAASLTLTNCTLSANQATEDGGALVTDSSYASGNALSILNFCTLSNNVASGTSGQAISGIAEGTVRLSNTLLNSNNLFTSFNGHIVSDGYNLSSDDGTGFLSAPSDQINTDPKLAPLANNGGPTKTIALIAGSPAIDAGNSTLTTDQRGFHRPSGSAPDIGAFEAGGLPALSVNNPRSLPEGSADKPGSVTFDITLSGPTAQSVTVNYQTRDGINNPATAGVDYVEKHGKLTFAPGETLKRVTVKFIGDDKAETKETFFLDLLTPTNATISDSRGVGTIVNDDATPSLFQDEPSQ